jgi:uncharacterized protein YndB with AHSA1/START domain
MKVRSIRQVAILPGTPLEVYTALMTTRGHRRFTGADARISPKVGGKFMAWDGYIHGTNLTLVPGRTIVQSWRATETSWPKDYYSRVRFDLTRSPKGTKLKFTHTGVPVEHAGHLAQGWKDHYWAPLRSYLSK